MIEQKRTILICDDDLALQTVLEIALREAGYQVILANDGQEGLEKYLTLKPNLVVTDIMMPQADGVEVFQRIKDVTQDDGVAVFVMTALNRKPWFDDMEADGAVFLQKPFEVDEFVDLVNDMLL